LSFFFSDEAVPPTPQKAAKATTKKRTNEDLAKIAAKNDEELAKLLATGRPTR